MPLKDLKGKSIYDLTAEDFAELYCCKCRQYAYCEKDEGGMHVCKALIDCGLWYKLKDRGK